MKKFLFAVALVMALGLVLSPAPARAIPVLDFDMAPPTPGSITYAGGNTPLVGVNIGVNTVTGLGTPLHDGVTLQLSSPTDPNHALLNFTTGNFTGFLPLTNWEFGGGGTISLVGAIAGIGLPFGTTIFSGSFVDADVSFNPANAIHKVWLDTFSDVKNTTLTDFYGLTTVPNIFVGSVNLSFFTVGADVPPAGFASSELFSGDITNQSGKVPEPISLILLGSGLAGAGLYRRLRRK